MEIAKIVRPTVWLWLLAAVAPVATDLGCGMRETLPPVVARPPGAPPLTDEQLNAAVHARLDQDWIFQSRDIRVASAAGVVMLSGWVETYTERTLAIDLVRTTPGVLRVNNDITVIRNY
ncbi:MAG TPA: BON domain-containing protein [Polyangia bacterium]|jgi:osmotically-inducible protein OsmY